MKTTRKQFTPIALLMSCIVIVGASCGGGTSVADGGVYKSIDQGETWEQKVFVGQQKKGIATISNVNIEELEFDPQNASTIYLASKGTGLYKTDTGGDQWRKLKATEQRVRDVEVDPIYTNNVYTVRGKNILKSVDSGETWETIYTDPQSGQISQVQVDWFNQQRVIATTTTGTVIVSEDEGVTWKVTQKLKGPIVELIMSPRDSRVLYMVVHERTMYKSTDGGYTWENLFQEEFKEQFDGFQRVRDLLMDPNDPNTLYIASPMGILKTTDGASTWDYVDTLIQRGDSRNGSIRNVTVIPGESDTILFTIGRLIHKTVDAGVSWKTLENFGSSREISELIIEPENPDVIYAGTLFVEQESGGLFGG